MIFCQNMNCGYTVEPPCGGDSNEYPQSMFWKLYTPVLLLKKWGTRTYYCDESHLHLKLSFINFQHIKNTCTCDTSQVLHVGVPGGFSRGSLIFRPTY